MHGILIIVPSLNESVFDFHKWSFTMQGSRMLSISRLSTDRSGVSSSPLLSVTLLQISPDWKKPKKPKKPKKQVKKAAQNMILF